MLTRSRGALAATTSAVSVLDLLAAAADAHPDACAVIADEVRLTYRELADLSDHIARALVAEHGVGPERTVAILAERSVWTVAGILGILKAGGAYLPVAEGLPDGRLAYLLDDGGAVALLTSADERRDPRWPGGRSLVIQSLAAPRAREIPLPAPLPRQLAYVIYTSGSSGQPKGVQVEHGALLDLARGGARTFRAEPGHPLRVGVNSSWAFDASVQQLAGALCWGNTLIVPPSGVVRDPAALLDHLRDHAVEVCELTTTLFGSLLQAGLGPAACPALRCLIVGGESLDWDTVARFYGDGEAACALRHQYGPTEASVYATEQLVESAAAPGGRVPIGGPERDAQVLVLDPFMSLAPVGVWGELYLGGAGVARGYAGQADVTAERFVPDPLGAAPGARVYRTGDRARWTAAGVLEYGGRLDAQLKVRGHRVEPGEVEAVLRRCEGVADAAVIARERAGGVDLVAFIVCGDAAPTREALRAAAAAQVPDALVPSEFIVVPRLPLTASGKVDRRALAGQTGGRLARARQFVEPSPGTETTLAAIWAAVLGVDAVSAADHYFQLGGDSISAIQVVSRARAAGLLLTLADLFARPVLRDLAGGARPPAAAPPDQGPVSGEAGLGAIQTWWLEGPGPHAHFNQSLVLRWRTRVDVSRLRDAVRRLQTHHDALRLTFARGADGAWRQTNHGLAHPVSVEAWDLRGRADARVALEDAASRLQASFDLATGPLFKVAVASFDAEDWVLLVGHHLVIDGVSWRIVLEDLAAIDDALARDEAPRLPAKTDAYLRWVAAVHACALSPALAAEREYWAAVCATETAAPPIDVEATEDVAASIDTVHVRLTRADTRRLLSEAHRAYDTEANDLLLAGLAFALGDWHGGRRSLIALEGHGREDVIPGADVSRTVGWFTSLYPVVLEAERAASRELDDDAALSRQIRAVKESLRQVPGKGVGYGILRYVTPGGRDDPALACAPAVLFNYLGAFDTDAERSAFTLLAESAGPDVSPAWHRDPPLTVTGVVVDGALEIGATWRGGLFRGDQVAWWLERYRTHLTRIADHAVGREPEVTPSDLTLGGLSLDGLAALLAANGATASAIEDLCPLAPMQEGLLFHGLYQPRSSAYFEQTGYRLRGALDPARFEAAWNYLLARHANLRVAIWTEGAPRPVQAVPRQRTVEFRHEDWRAWPAEEQRARLAAFRAEDRQRGFDFARDVLLRVAVFRTGAATFDVVWSFHHLLLDGWSGAILTDELEAVYAALMRGEEPALPPVKPYRQYLRWLDAQDRAASGAYWSAALAGYEATASVPGEGRPAPGHASGDTRVRAWRLGQAETEALDAWAQATGVTVGTALQTLWGVLLGRYTGRADVVFGTTVAGRPAGLPDVERMVGLFINTLPVRVRWTGDDTVAALARRVQAAAVAREPHAALPLWEIQAASPLRGALFDHVLIVENYPRGRAVPAGARTEWQIDAVEAFEHVHYPLGVVVTRGADGLEWQVSHDPDVYPATQIERLLAHWGEVLACLRTTPDARVRDLDVLPVEERRAVLAAFNDTARSHDPATSLQALIEAQAEHRPDAVAVGADDAALSYGELNRRANRLARFLGEQGIGPDRSVGVCLERSAAMVTALVAILKAGACYVPLDPDLPDERLQHIVRDSGCSWLLTTTALGGRPGLAGVPRLELDRADEALGRQSADNLPRLAGPAHAAYIIYTSGSTGEPKGVEITNGALLNHMRWFQATFELDASDRVLQKTPFGFDASVWEFWAPLVAGGRLVMTRPGGHRDAASLEAAIVEHGITTLQVVPLQLSMLLQQDAFTRAPLLRRVFVGGEALPADLRDRFLAATTARLYNLYGPAETCVDATYWACSADGPNAPTPIGRPIDNTTAYVLDDACRPAPIGVWGELYLGGAGVARGYAGRAGLTAERFVPDPFGATPGGRLYRTGDRARWDEAGVLAYGGRLDTQVKVRGQRVEPGEVEAALRRSSGIRDAAVVAHAGAAGTELVAYLVCGADAPTLESLRDEVSARLPAALVPSSFVVVTALPLTTGGKVDRRALAGWTGGQLKRGRTHIAPATPGEMTLATIWAAVLDVASVGRDDQFFALGGDSIKAIQVVARARTAGLALTVADVFAQPVLSALAAVARPLTSAPRDQGTVTGTAGLGPMQARWLEGPGPHAHFNQSLVLRWRGRVDVARLRDAVRRLQTHHDALRLTFARGADGAWRQTNHGLPHPVSVEAWDLRGRADARVALEDAASRLQASFDLATGPLFKVAVASFDAEDWVLLVGHHLVIDGVSWRIVLEDLAAIDDALARDEAPRLPAKTDAYLRWVAAVEASGTSPERQAERAYWAEVCAADTVALPVDADADEGGTAQVRLTPDETSALIVASARAYGTDANDLLLAGLSLALQDWHGGARTLVALEGHGREALGDVDVSRTVGWFTSLYPVVLAVPDTSERTGDAALSWQIRGVKEALRQVPDKGVGYGILRHVRPDGRADEALACEPPVLFNYLGWFDTTAAAAPFTVGGESAGAEVMPAGHRAPPLTVTGVVVQGALELSASWTSGHFRRGRVVSWLDRYRAHLGRIAAHCAARAPEVTPSDLTLGGLDLPAYEALLAAHDLPAAAVQDVCPLAPLQEGLLFHGLAAPGSRAYVEQTGYRLQGPLDPARFEAAWQYLLERHDNLRVRIGTLADGRPVQIVPRQRPLEYRFEDWRTLPPAERQARLAAYRAADRARGFDFARDGLLRVALFRTGATEHDVVWSFHHLLLDGWSGAILTAELEAVYAALTAGEPPALPAVTPYRRYLQWLAAQDSNGERRVLDLGARGLRDGGERAARRTPDGEHGRRQTRAVVAARAGGDRGARRLGASDRRDGGDGAADALGRAARPLHGSGRRGVRDDGGGAAGGAARRGADGRAVHQYAAGARAVDRRRHGGGARAARAGGGGGARAARGAAALRDSGGESAPRRALRSRAHRRELPARAGGARRTAGRVARGSGRRGRGDALRARAGGDARDRRPAPAHQPRPGAVSPRTGGASGLALDPGARQPSGRARCARARPRHSARGRAPPVARGAQRNPGRRVD